MLSNILYFYEQAAVVATEIMKASSSKAVCSLFPIFLQYTHTRIAKFKHGNKFFAMTGERDNILHY